MKSLLLLAFTLLQSSCSAAETSSQKTVERKARISAHGLPLKTLVFSNGVRLEVEMAATPSSRTKGLMNRDSLGKNKGMLFKFDRAHILSFWMKNTYIPLEIGYFTDEKKLVNTLVMKPQSRGPLQSQDLQSYQSLSPCVYALEVNPGWFSKNNIKAGSTFRTL